MDADDKDVTGPQPPRGDRAEQMDPKPTDELIVGEAKPRYLTGKNPDGSENLAVEVEGKPDPELLAHIVASSRKALEDAIASGQPFGVVTAVPEGVSLTGMLSPHHLHLAFLGAMEAIEGVREDDDE